MVGYEYKVIPAPAKGLKARGIKGPEARFANALEHRINEMAADGWEYLRADILPSEERQGLTSTQTVYRSVLVFRRATEIEEIAEDTAEDIADDSTDEDAADEAISAVAEDEAEIGETPDGDEATEDKT